MIWYTIIATVLLFKYGYVARSENVLSINAVPAPLNKFKYICAIHRHIQGTQVRKFICVGVLVGIRYAVTSASCVNTFNDGSEMFIYVNTSIRDQGYVHKIVGITFNPTTNGPHTSIAILKTATKIGKGSTVGSIIMPKTDRVSPGRDLFVISYRPEEGTNTYILKKTKTTISPVQNAPINSFVAGNREGNESLLNNADYGAAAVRNGHIIGILSSTTRGRNATATFINLFVMKNFISSIIQRR